MAPVQLPSDPPVPLTTSFLISGWSMRLPDCAMTASLCCNVVAGCAIRRPIPTISLPTNWQYPLSSRTPSALSDSSPAGGRCVADVHWPWGLTDEVSTKWWTGLAGHWRLELWGRSGEDQLRGRSFDVGARRSRNGDVGVGAKEAQSKCIVVVGEQSGGFRGWAEKQSSILLG